MKFQIPADLDFLADLILQRTGAFIKLGGGAVLNNWFDYGDKDGLVKFLVSTNLIETYLNLVISEISHESKVIRDVLPSDAFSKIISIGPGNGVLEAALLNSLPNTSELLLIDIESSQSHRHGYASSGSGYANLEKTKKVLEDNLLSPPKILLCNPTYERIPHFEFTLCLSCLSMGFHYPCSTYSDVLIDSSALNSYLVFDLRRGVEDLGYQKIRSFFDVVHSIPCDKSDRLFLSKVR